MYYIELLWCILYTVHSLYSAFFIQVEWLKEHFEKADDACNIPKTVLYGHYQRHCWYTLSIDPLSASVLGKLVRSTFIGLSVKLLGSGYV